jgi:hypothetical protein
MRKECLIESKINAVESKINEIENIVLFTKVNKRERNKMILAVLVALGMVVVALKAKGWL